MPTAPSYSPLRNLTYIHEENLSKTEFGGPTFGGYPSSLQRTDSYDIRDSMTIHCGFVRGTTPVGELALTLMMLIFLTWSSDVESLLHQQFLEPLIYYESRRLLVKLQNRMSASICFWIKKHMNI